MQYKYLDKIQSTVPSVTYRYVCTPSVKPAIMHMLARVTCMQTNIPREFDRFNSLFFLCWEFVTCSRKISLPLTRLQIAGRRCKSVNKLAEEVEVSAATYEVCK